MINKPQVLELGVYLFHKDENMRIGKKIISTFANGVESMNISTPEITFSLIGELNAEISSRMPVNSISCSNIKNILLSDSGCKLLHYSRLKSTASLLVLGTNPYIKALLGDNLASMLPYLDCDELSSNISKLFSPYINSNDNGTLVYYAISLITNFTFSIEREPTKVELIRTFASRLKTLHRIKTLCEPISAVLKTLDPKIRKSYSIELPDGFRASAKSLRGKEIKLSVFTYTEDSYGLVDKFTRRVINLEGEEVSLKTQYEDSSIDIDEFSDNSESHILGSKEFYSPKSLSDTAESDKFILDNISPYFFNFGSERFKSWSEQAYIELSDLHDMIISPILNRAGTDVSGTPSVTININGTNDNFQRFVTHSYIRRAVAEKTTTLHVMVYDRLTSIMFVRSVFMINSGGGKIRIEQNSTARMYSEVVLDDPKIMEELNKKLSKDSAILDYRFTVNDAGTNVITADRANKTVVEKFNTELSAKLVLSNKHLKSEFKDKYVDSGILKILPRISEVNKIPDTIPINISTEVTSIGLSDSSTDLPIPDSFSGTVLDGGVCSEVSPTNSKLETNKPSMLDETKKVAIRIAAKKIIVLCKKKLLERESPLSFIPEPVLEAGIGKALSYILTTMRDMIPLSNEIKSSLAEELNLIGLQSVSDEILMLVTNTIQSVVTETLPIIGEELKQLTAPKETIPDVVNETKVEINA